MISYESLIQNALRLLNYRPHHSAELERKLKRKYGPDSATLTKVIDELKRVKLLNDGAYTELYIQELTQKPIGRHKILAHCARRGIPRAEAEMILASLDWNESENARRAIAERNLSDRPRRITFLKGRGFSARAIFGAIR